MGVCPKIGNLAKKLGLWQIFGSLPDFWVFGQKWSLPNILVIWQKNGTSANFWDFAQILGICPIFWEFDQYVGNWIEGFFYSKKATIVSVGEGVRISKKVSS